MEYEHAMSEEPTREREVTRLCGQITDSLDSLGSDLSQLFERLHPILGMDTDMRDPTLESVDPENETPLGIHLSTILNEVNRLRRSVSAVAKRVEV